jgi:HD-like signal output (HDOD) protein
MRIFKRKQQDTKEELRELLDGYELPSFPGVVMDVLAMLRDPDTTVGSIGEQIQKDPALLVKVLSTVNAAAFGLPVQVSNINRATALLGLSRLESIILSHAVKDTVSSQRPPWFDARQFWAGAARRANLARQLALRLHPTTEVESFTAGMLQDMAVLVLATVKPKEYQEIFFALEGNNELWLHNLEQEKFSFDHQAIGSLMAEEWDLSEYLVNAISQHHNEAFGDEMIDPAVHLVTYIRSTGVESGIDEFKARCSKHYQLDEVTVSQMLESADEDAAQLKEVLA